MLKNQIGEQEDNFTWLLGDDFVCETCGPTWNEVGLELWDEEEGIWQLYIRVGCYEGESVMSDDPEWKARASDIIKQALWYLDFSESDAEDLRDRIALIKGENR